MVSDAFVLAKYINKITIKIVLDHPLVIIVTKNKPLITIVVYRQREVIFRKHKP